MRTCLIRKCIRACPYFLVLKRGFGHFESIQLATYTRTVAMARFDSRIPAMWRRNKVTFFLSVRLLRDHPEDVDGITSQARLGELGDTVLIRARSYPRIPRERRNGRRGRRAPRRSSLI